MIGAAQKQFGVTSDDHQQVVEVVGHAAGQPSHRLHFFRLANLGFQPVELLLGLAGELVGKECLVHTFEHLLRYIIRLTSGPAGGKGERNFPSVVVHFQPMQPGQHAQHLLRTTFGQEHEKFVAPHAYRNVAAANGFSYVNSKVGEHQVAGGMAVAVVDLLEIVEVKHQHREQVILPSGPGNLDHQVLLQKAPVVEAGEGIGQDQLAELLCTEFLLCDDFQLACQLTPQPANQNQLVDDMNAEKEHQPQQALHGLVQVVRGERALFLCQRREGERDDCQYQQEHNNDGSSPEPQIALFESLQPALDLEHAKISRFLV